MEKTSFKKLLFDIACSAVTCDGKIDAREVDELKYIDKSTTYFEDIDLSKRLERFINDYKSEPSQTIEGILENLSRSTLTPVEEMLVIEIVLRLIYSDTKIDNLEIEFIKKVRAFLKIADNLIIQRFGEIEFLVKSKDKIVKVKEQKKNKMIDIDMENLENMYFSLDQKPKK